MWLGEALERFVEESPVAVMVSAILERIFDPERLEQVFEDHAVRGYTLELTFAACVTLMSDVVTRAARSVWGYYQAHLKQFSVTYQAVTGKINRLEAPVGIGLVRHVAQQVRATLQALPLQRRPWLPGWRLRILDGTFLAGTQRRLKKLRRVLAAALPGHALVLYDPQDNLIEDVVLCRDAYQQERACFPEVLERIAAQDCVVADRNCCTRGVVFGVDQRDAAFILRRHKQMPLQALGDKRLVGTDPRGRKVYEQAVEVEDPETGQTLRLRCITVALDKPTRKGDTELEILTNLPEEDADAVRVAELYGDRWPVEHAFQRLKQDLRCEVDTLAHPDAALFAFCVAAVAYNAVALVKAAIEAAHGEEVVEEEVSTYYLAEEVARVTPGLRIAVPEPEWEPIRCLPDAAFAALLVAWAQQMDLRKYRKHKRGPKKPAPPKTIARDRPHVSTARILGLPP